MGAVFLNYFLPAPTAHQRLRLFNAKKNGIQRKLHAKCRVGVRGMRLFLSRAARFGWRRYSTTSAFSMTTGSTGTSPCIPRDPVGTAAMASTTSFPSTILPNTA